MSIIVDETITLNPCQSLALRRLIDALKADDSIYTACPDVIRNAFCDFYMPPYSSAERQIVDAEASRDEAFRLLDKFAHKIKTLEAQLDRRRANA